MLTFHATAVEVFSEDSILTIHFDDQADRYLQLQAPMADDPVEFEPGYGNVYVEVNDQLHSGFNCFSAAELARDRFRITFARDPAMEKLGGVEVTFAVDDAAFAELRQALTVAFRAYPGYRPPPAGT